MDDKSLKYLQDMKKNADMKKYMKKNAISPNEIDSSLGLLSLLKGSGALALALKSDPLNSNEEEELAKYKEENPKNSRKPAALDEARLNAMSAIKTSADREIQQKINKLGQDIMNSDKMSSEYPTIEEYEEDNQMSVDRPRLDDPEAREKLRRMLRGEE